MEVADDPVHCPFVSIDYIICECGDTFPNEEELKDHLEKEHAIKKEKPTTPEKPIVQPKPITSPIKKTNAIRNITPTITTAAKPQKTLIVSSGKPAAPQILKRISAKAIPSNVKISPISLPTLQYTTKPVQHVSVPPRQVSVKPDPDGVDSQSEWKPKPTPSTSKPYIITRPSKPNVETVKQYTVKTPVKINSPMKKPVVITSPVKKCIITSPPSKPSVVTKSPVKVNQAKATVKSPNTIVVKRPPKPEPVASNNVRVYAQNKYGEDRPIYILDPKTNKIYQMPTNAQEEMEDGTDYVMEISDGQVKLEPMEQEISEDSVAVEYILGEDGARADQDEGVTYFYDELPAVGEEAAVGLQEEVKVLDNCVYCNICGRSCLSVKQLNTHVKRSHLTPLKERGPCEVCGRTHIISLGCPVCRQKEAKPKKCVCDICGNKYASNAALRYHQRIHTGEKPYPCTECPKRFTMPLLLQIHLRRHTGERPYQCQDCPKAFTNRAALLRHERVHTGVKPYVCPECGKAFTQSNSLKLHIRTVHLKLPTPYKSAARRRLAQQRHGGAFQEVPKTGELLPASYKKLNLARQMHRSEQEEEAGEEVEHMEEVQENMVISYVYDTSELKN